ncbi:hypothetical protein JEK38_09260 [Klebsiella pneumoniae]|uniref:hypothetical protein n=1 Tax=Klebsiella pneumoniae TaxID=573 RepID=UPI00211898DA|nr:hypothetical protein [Klebsiella pneumoniae]MCQ8380256.1 hypothetical protein [Klebsiella pneumoniae]
MKASAMSSDVVFSPVLSFNKNVMGMAIDNVANTVVNVSISSLPTFLAILNKSLFLKSPLYHEITKKMINDITAIMIKINDAEGGDIIFVIDGMCGRNVNIKNKVENPQPNHGIDIGLLIILGNIEE